MLHGSYFSETFHVKVLLVAEDDVAVRLVGHVLLLKLDHVLKRDLGQRLVDGAVDVIVDAERLGLGILAEDGCLRGALRGYALLQGLLGKGEGSSDCGTVSMMALKVRMQSIILSFCEMMWVMANSGCPLREGVT